MVALGPAFSIILLVGELSSPVAAEAQRPRSRESAAADDPVGSGLVTSLARPGGNVTGLSMLAPELVGKKLELLKQAVPAVTQVALLCSQGAR